MQRTLTTSQLDPVGDPRAPLTYRIWELGALQMQETCDRDKCSLEALFSLEHQCWPDHISTWYVTEITIDVKESGCEERGEISAAAASLI